MEGLFEQLSNNFHIYEKQTSSLVFALPTLLTITWYASQQSLQQGLPTWWPGASGRPQGPSRSPAGLY